MRRCYRPTRNGYLKICYETELSALISATYHNKKIRWHAYQCWVCGSWHVTKRTQLLLEAGR